MNQSSHAALLAPLLAERILLLDGAMGTMIQAERLGEAEFRGERFRDWPKELRGNNDLLVLTQPQIVRRIHAGYLEAGRRHHLDQHIQRDVGLACRLRHANARVRLEPGGGAAGEEGRA
jgi:S-methylmethionine-dependent homocysteine/selenocysteine methylase